MSDALIEGVSGAIGAITALVSTYPLLTVSQKEARNSPADTGEAARAVANTLLFLPQCRCPPCAHST